MDPISQKINRWIGEGKDSRSAHWQGGLEKILNLFSPVLEPGKLVPVQPLEANNLSVFKKALEVTDLSPHLIAAFLPPSIAGKITPPASADELQRIDDGKPSYKILIARPGKGLRIICAEISAHSNKPGVDIFQSGALLGTYDFHTQEECMAGLTQTIRVHAWKKGQWNREEYKQYTIAWFEKMLALGTGTVPVQENFSYLHSPTLIKSDRIDAIFTLIQDILYNRFMDADDPDRDAISSIRSIEDEYVRTSKLNQFVEKCMLDLLNAMRVWKIVNFGEFSNREIEQFQKEFPKAVRHITRQVIGKSQEPPREASHIE